MIAISGTRRTKQSLCGAVAASSGTLTVGKTHVFIYTHVQIHTHTQSLEIAVSIFSGMRDRRPKNRGSISGRDRIFFSSLKLPLTVLNTQPHIKWVPGFLVWSKVAEAWSCLLNLVKNRWGYTLTPPYAFTACARTLSWRYIHTHICRSVVVTFFY